jgi:hypothetical protein
MTEEARPPRADGDTPSGTAVTAAISAVDAAATAIPPTLTSRPRRPLRAAVTDRPVAIAMVAIGVLIFGWVSARGIPVNLMPDLSYPTLTVRTEYPQAAPEEVERDITEKVEAALGSIPGPCRRRLVRHDGPTLLGRRDLDADIRDRAMVLRNHADRGAEAFVCGCLVACRAGARCGGCARLVERGSSGA